MTNDSIFWRCWARQRAWWRGCARGTATGLSTRKVRLETWCSFIWRWWRLIISTTFWQYHHQSPPHPACQKARVTDWSLTRASVATRVRLECEREYQAKIIVLCQKYFVCTCRSTSCCRWCPRTSRPRWSGAWCWRWRTATARSSGRLRSSRTSSSRGTATSGPRQRADTSIHCACATYIHMRYNSDVWWRRVDDLRI